MLVCYGVWSFGLSYILFLRFTSWVAYVACSVLSIVTVPCILSRLVGDIAGPSLIRCRPTKRGTTYFFCHVDIGLSLFTRSCMKSACCSDHGNMEFGAIINTISGKTSIASRSLYNESDLVRS